MKTSFVIAAIVAASISNTVSAVAIREEPTAAVAQQQRSAQPQSEVTESHLLDFEFVPFDANKMEALATPQPCMHGKFWAGEERGCITCSTGHYCPEGTLDFQFPCPAGTFNDMQGQWNCTICPPGNFCPEQSS